MRALTLEQLRPFLMFLGVFFIFVGIFLLLVNYELIKVDWAKVWPIFLVAAGLGLLSISMIRD